MVTETSTATGAATSTGITSASRGTAMRASPKPKVERISVAKNKTQMTWRAIQSITVPIELTANANLPANVVAHYNRVRALSLTAIQQQDLVEYLKSL